jgi:electron transfer flavoprotein beta subunit
MKILVPTKRVPDPDQKIRLRDDRRRIDDSSVTYVVNPFDAIAAEEAVRIREGTSVPTEVVAVTVGPDDCETELRTILAMGADRALLIECDEPLDPWNIARLLRAMVDREQPDLVLMGKQAVDDDANQTGQFLAAMLDWPQATFASRIGMGDDGVTVARETDAGIEIVHISLPALITADLRLNEPRYASLPSILKSRQKPLERIGFAALGVVIEPRLQVLQMELNSTGRNCVQVASVDVLLDQLRNEAKVI